MFVSIALLIIAAIASIKGNQNIVNVALLTAILTFLADMWHELKYFLQYQNLVSDAIMADLIIKKLKSKSIEDKKIKKALENYIENHIELLNKHDK